MEFHKFVKILIELFIKVILWKDQAGISCILQCAT